MHSPALTTILAEDAELLATRISTHLFDPSNVSAPQDLVQALNAQRFASQALRMVATRLEREAKEAVS